MQELLEAVVLKIIVLFLVISLGNILILHESVKTILKIGIYLSIIVLLFDLVIPYIKRK